MSWCWRHVYPTCRVVTLVLDPAEAEAPMAAARTSGTAIGKATIRGLPMAAGAPAAAPVARKTRRNIETVPPATNVTILPVVRREPMATPESASAIRDLQPPRDDAPSAIAKAVDPATRSLIDAAIAAGKVTKCPPCKHSVEPGEWLPGEGGWRDPNKRPGKGRKGRFDFRRTGEKVRPETCGSGRQNHRAPHLDEAE